MKKKILSLAMIVCMLSIAIVGGTLAYFTDTDDKTNVFTVGNIEIDLEEQFPSGELMPDVVKEKVVTVKNVGDNDAYMWIEVWVPAALDDGDDNSPAAPGLGNSLHFNYDGKTVVETKNTYLGSQYMKADKEGQMAVCNANDEGAVAYNGYVHYIKNDAAKAKDVSTSALLDQVYMDKKCAQCEDHDNCMILMDGTHYTGAWNLHVNAVGIQTADNIKSITDAVSAYYAKDVTAYIW